LNTVYVASLKLTARNGFVSSDITIMTSSPIRKNMAANSTTITKRVDDNTGKEKEQGDGKEEKMQT
jgi:hypothetical protein